MTVNARNGIALSGISAIDGVAKSGLTAINGQAIAGGGGGGSFDETIGGNTGNTYSGLDQVLFETAGSTYNGQNPATWDFLGATYSTWFKPSNAALASVKGAGTVTLTVAKLRIYKELNFGSGTVTAYNCLRAGTTSMNGNTYDGTNAWAAAGGTGSGDRSASSIGTVSVGTGVSQYYEIDLDLTTEQNRINGVITNNGILLYASFYSEYTGTTGTNGQRIEFRYAGTR